MKKKSIIIGLVLFSVVFLIIVFNFLPKDPNDLPKGELVKEVSSPSHKSSIRMYLVNEGGATSRFQMRGEVVYANQKSKTIYFNYDEDRTDVKWLDENNVIINGEKLNIKTDFYYWKDDPKWDEKRERKYQ